MLIRSIHTRLLIGAALATCLALILAGSGLVWLFQRHVEQREALSLEAKARELLPALQIDRTGAPRTSSSPTDGRFWRPASGLYWQVSTSAGLIHSRSLWDQRLDTAIQPTGEQWEVNRVPGPYGHRLLVISRMIKPAGSNQPALVQFASDDDALTYSLREFRIETALALLLLWVVLIVASALQVRLGLRPLTRVQTELGQLRKNSSARLSSNHPREVSALVEAINALADARAADVERARHRAADLAHSLKTPLAALAAQSRRARSEGAAGAADAIDRTIAVARAALEAELTRARSAVARDARGASANVLEVVEQIVSVVEQTESGGSKAFEVEILDTVVVPVAAPELAELLGALIENAARFARRRVRVTSLRDSAETCICVDDDGPGLQKDRVHGALTRGTRLDEAGPGHGFGLAIVKDLIDATGGTMELATAPVGGLRVCLRWRNLA